MMANMADSGSERPFGQCRCCLSFGYHRDIEVARKVLLQTFNLLLATNTELTSMICTLCIRRLEDAVDFKSMILESEKELLKCLNKNSNNEFDNVAQTNDARVKEEYEGIVQEINDTDEEMNQDQNVKHEEMVQEHNSSHKEMDNDVDSDINDALLQDASKGTVQAKNDNQEEINQDQDVKNEEMMQGQNSTYTQNEIDSNVAEDSANNDNINVTNLQNDSDINKIVTCEVAVANQIVTYQIAIDKSNQHENNDDVDKNQTNTEEDGEIDEMKNEVVTRKETGDIDSDATNVDSGDDDNVEGQIDTLREVVNGRAIEQLFIVTDKQHENGVSLNNELTSTMGGTSETVQTPKLTQKHEIAQTPETAIISEIAQTQETLLPKPFKTANIRKTTKQTKRKSVAPRSDKIEDQEADTFSETFVDAVSTRNTGGDAVFIPDEKLKHANKAQVILTKLDETKKFACPKCKYTTDVARCLKAHIEAHSAPVSFICDTCHHICYSKNQLIVHYRKHTGEKPYSCKFCHKKFAVKGECKSHSKIHTDKKPFTCDICDKALKTKRQLSLHTRIHTDERPYGCKICDKSFKSTSSLNNHMRLHTTEKSKPCKICGKEFSENGTLALHMKVHTSEKPFECEICHEKFAHKQSFIRHKRNIHRNEKSDLPNIGKNVTNVQGDGNVDEKVKNKKENGQIDEMVTRQEADGIDSDATNVDDSDNGDNIVGQMDTQEAVNTVANAQAIEQLFIVTRTQPENGVTLNNELKSTTDETLEKLQTLEVAQISETAQILETAHIPETAQTLETIVAVPNIRKTTKQRKKKSLAPRTNKIKDQKACTFTKTIARAVSTKSNNGDAESNTDKKLKHTIKTRDKTTELVEVKSYSCPKCKYATNIARCLRAHIEAHSAPVSYICDTCHHICESKNQLIVHYRKHTGEKPYACKFCHKKFAVKGECKSHSQLHTDEKPFTCDICDKSFKTKRQLSIHTRIHTDERPYGCKICDKRFKQCASVRTHMRKHTGEKSAPCNICGKEVSLYYLHMHMRVHTGEKPYECDTCHRTFAHRNQLVRHKRIDKLKKGKQTSEKSDIPHACRLYLAHTKSSKQKKHVKLATTDKYKCEICLLDFLNRDTLNIHTKTHIDKKVYVCQICKIKFAQRSSFVSHVKTHANENISVDAADNPYYCDICDKHFVRRQALKIHLKVHTGEKVANKKSCDCKVCGKKLSRPETLDYHVRVVHMGEKPPSDKTYACEICDRKFSRRFNLEQHVVRVHTGKK